MPTIALPILKAKIVEKLQAVVDIQEVHDYATINFNGYPAANVLFESIESDYETTKENVRIYNFLIDLFYESEATTREKAEAYIQELGEQIVDLFEGDEFLSGISMPSGKVIMGIHPSLNPLEWEDKWVRMRVTLPIKISFDTTI